MKVRALAVFATLALAGGAPPLILDGLGTNEPPLVEVQTWVQHINVLTS
ncbi:MULTISPECIES: hypothetical protein [unclassified Nonomuraea]